jgi:hypothetical protein
MDIINSMAGKTPLAPMFEYYSQSVTAIAGAIEGIQDKNFDTDADFILTAECSNLGVGPQWGFVTKGLFKALDKPKK